MNAKKMATTIVVAMMALAMITVAITAQICQNPSCEKDCGTKVEQCDTETVFQLTPVAPGTAVGFYDIDNDGVFDANEGAVIDMDPTSLTGAGIISDGDVRISDCIVCGNVPANTLVDSCDGDAGQVITPFPAAADGNGPFRFADMIANGQMDMAEGIYLDADGSRDVSPNDIRLTKSPVLQIGTVAPGTYGAKWSRVQFGNGDVGANLIAVPAYLGSAWFNGPPGFAQGVLAFVDSDCSAGIWSRGDKLYLQQPHGDWFTATGWQYDIMVTFGDVRLYIPANDPCVPECGTKVSQCTKDAVYAVTRSNDANGGALWQWGFFGDAVYMDMNGDGVVTIDDVRLSVSDFCEETYQPNTLVEANDCDLGTVLTIGNQRALRYTDLNGNGGYDTEDPLYLDVDSTGGLNGQVSIDDIRLTDAPVCDGDTSFGALGSQKLAWSRVKSGDPELVGGVNLWFLTNVPRIPTVPGDSGTPRNALGYVDVDCSLDWSSGDILYVQQAHGQSTANPSEQHDAYVTIGDSRLYVPLNDPCILKCGTKVIQCDEDMTYALEDTGMNIINWGYIDGNNVNVFDGDDSGYIDMDSNGIVTEGDVRVSKGCDEPNTMVMNGDCDINLNLHIPVDQVVLTYWDINQNDIFDMADPIYIDADSDGDVSLWDIRVTMSPPYDVAGWTAGQCGANWTKVQGPDLDMNMPLTRINTGIPAIELRYVDSECSVSWSLPDKLYLQQIHQLWNLGFETGTLDGWFTLGAVEAVQASNFAPNMIAPPEGDFYALLSTGGVGPLGPSGVFDMDGALGTENDVAIMIRSFVVTAPTEVSFDLAFLTGEADQPAAFDDIFTVIVSQWGPFIGPNVLTGSVPQTAPGPGTSPFPDYGPLNGINYGFTSAALPPVPNPCDGSIFDDGVTPFQSYNYQITNPGLYWITFYVGDHGNRNYDSGLLIDDVSLGEGAEFVTIGDTRFYMPVNDSGPQTTPTICEYYDDPANGGDGDHAIDKAELVQAILDYMPPQIPPFGAGGLFAKSDLVTMLLAYLPPGSGWC